MEKTIILVSHYGLATGMKKAAEFIIGEQENFYAVELTDDGVEVFKDQISMTCSKNDIKKEVILISDIPSGSPGTTAYVILNEIRKVTLVTGMNLPLVLELLLMREIKPTKILIDEALVSSKKALSCLSEDIEEDDFEEEDDF